MGENRALSGHHFILFLVIKLHDVAIAVFCSNWTSSVCENKSYFYSYVFKSEKQGIYVHSNYEGKKDKCVIHL